MYISPIGNYINFYKRSGEINSRNTYITLANAHIFSRKLFLLRTLDKLRKIRQRNGYTWWLVYQVGVRINIA